MVLEYAEGGNFNNWMNKNYRNFSWFSKINTLYNISNGLKEIHQKKIVHRDLHTGNILFFINDISMFDCNMLSISDMGLCGEIGNVDKSKIYGVMPYVAPEVLSGKPYTQAADIYSFVLQFQNNEYEIEEQFKEAEEYRKANLSSNENNQSAIHPQAVYISRSLNSFTDCLDCRI
ncbi:uncharacterized protein OCT59_007923 [Rhizophagus irregularis]|uniref:uncharacterized protein n=1 Tax=Rhizophagus irregularis TaxID=588596 RepID=UPI00332056A9|nr:hypothetical protein OCT59_007923 [Rhizophagus irregularis]